MWRVSKKYFPNSKIEFLNIKTQKIGNFLKKYFNGVNIESLSIDIEGKDYEVIMPITCRTRAAGGWQGKSLFMTTPGLKIT